MKVNLILTGGTIGSKTDENGIIDTSPENAAAPLLDDLFVNMPSCSDSIEFNITQPFDLLSENLNHKHWNDLLQHLKTINMAESNGIVITHGTDTLAFTANLMALMFCGTDIPVFLISSSKPLTNSEANGFDNFRMAIKLIIETVEPLVYVPYKNRNGEMNIHRASRIQQSDDLSPDFYSAHRKLNNTDKICKELGNGMPLLQSIEKLRGNILTIAPHPGLNYNNYNLDNVDAVLHRTYHSSTLSAGTSCDCDDIYSILRLKKLCDERNIPLYFAPVLSGANQVYSSTDKIIKRGVIPLFDMTFEMSYIYLILKESLSL